MYSGSSVESISFIEWIAVERPVTTIKVQYLIFDRYANKR